MKEELERLASKVKLEKPKDKDRLKDLKIRALASSLAKKLKVKEDAES